jgi:hypothetical protein
MFRIIFGIGLVISAFGAVLFWDGFAGDGTPVFDLPAAQATTYQDPRCGCCGSHVEYMEKAGFIVTQEMTDELSAFKDELGIPADLRSCHTTLAEGYVIEGHIPSEAIAKLLEEKPDIRGIALPAMPSGTPGMDGSKDEVWVIYALEHNGTVSVFMEI